MGHPRLSILLIINSGRERIAIKVANLHAQVSEVYFIGDLMPSIINVRGTMLTGVLDFSFTPNGYASLQCGAIHMQLPETVPLQWRNTLKLKRAIRQQHRVSAMILDDYGVCHPLPSRSGSGALQITEQLDI